MFSVMDECMGIAAWMDGYTVVAANVTINYRDMLPLHTTLRMEAHVDQVEGRKVRTSASLKTADGKIVADSQGLFIVVSTETMGNKIPGTHDSVDRFKRWLNRQRASNGS